MSAGTNSLCQLNADRLRLIVKAVLMLTISIALVSTAIAQESQNTTTDETVKTKPKPAVDSDKKEAKAPEKVSEAAGPQNPPTSKWEFAVTPYFFLAGLNGRVGALGQTVQVDAKFSEI